MSPKLKLRLLSYLHSQQLSEGFTLIELLVVIIIIAILAAIAMPSFISQAAKARQSEAKQNVGLINRAQAEYRIENQQFSNSFDALSVGGGLQGNNVASTQIYTYDLASTDPKSHSTVIAYPKDTADRSYAGGNLIYANSAGVVSMSSIICESKSTGVGVPPVVQFTETTVDCPNSDYYRLEDTKKGN
jgi:type IV pilus assembly protein PilA